MEKPLFIPLRGKWFDKFADGSKTVEYRPFGPRWNCGTLWKGRPVTLSRGYGKHERLHGEIVDWKVVGPSTDPAIAEVYPQASEIAAIAIRIVPRSTGAPDV